MGNNTGCPTEWQASASLPAISPECCRASISDNGMSKWQNFCLLPNDAERKFRMVCGEELVYKTV